ncbi:hypothetical protein [Pseudomonas psychrophila]|uniref:Uncharacterized protein n=1 Tax=Pseudomonas psychrophila TaxID=122355 RepID=A0A8I1K7C8_9PSED|nr:hypothetical protein [Pseudomonas psychrophila]AVX93350.1 hypothetical protein PkP19E3_35250 [Pseudomonas koreensis]MBJ2259694.1 hypothetical protein [Pseudomonas psychrophila]
MSQTNKNAVKVGEFRRRVEHLYRKLSDYHACCSADEVRDWKRVAQDLLEEVSALQCGRASIEDLEAHKHAVEAVTERLAAADKRIEAYAMKSAAKAALQKPTLPALRLIQGGKLH